MGFLSQYSGTVIVDAETGQVVPDGAPRPRWWIELLKALRHEDHIVVDKLLASSMSMRPTDDGQANTTIGGEGLVAQGEEILVRSIVDWNLTDENDESIPVGKPSQDMPKQMRDQQLELTRRSIARLPEQTILGLKLVTQRANRPKKDGEVARFPGGDQEGDPGRRADEGRVDAGELLDAPGVLAGAGSEA